MAYKREPFEPPDKEAEKKKAAYERMKEVSLWMVRNAWKRDDPHEDILDKERWTKKCIAEK